MIITNKNALFQAIEQDQHFSLTNEGEIQTQGWFSRFVENFCDLFRTSQAIQVRNEQIQTAMANLVTRDSTLGPQNLQQPLSPTNPFSQENTSEPREILFRETVNHYTRKHLQDYPEEIKNGTSRYLQAKLLRDHPGGIPDILQLKAVTEEELIILKQNPNTLGHLASGYSMGPGDLQNQMEFLANGFQEAITDLWSKSRHMTDYDEHGIYCTFKLDSPRERPVIQGTSYSRSEFSNTEDVQTRYNELILKEFPEKSMAAVVSTSMSQTVLPNLSHMVQCINTTCPLNPYTTQNPDLGDIIPTITSRTGNDVAPRMILTHDNNTIFLELNYGISLNDLNNSDIRQEVGSVKALVEIPKDQFPLPLGTTPNIIVTDMRLERPHAFTGTNNTEE